MKPTPEQLVKAREFIQSLCPQDLKVCEVYFRLSGGLEQGLQMTSELLTEKLATLLAETVEKAVNDNDLHRVVPAATTLKSYDWAYPSKAGGQMTDPYKTKAREWLLKEGWHKHIKLEVAEKALATLLAETVEKAVDYERSLYKAENVVAPLPWPRVGDWVRNVVQKRTFQVVDGGITSGTVYVHEDNGRQHLIVDLEPATGDKPEERPKQEVLPPNWDDGTRPEQPQPPYAEATGGKPTLTGLHWDELYVDVAAGNAAELRYARCLLDLREAVKRIADLDGKR